MILRTVYYERNQKIFIFVVTDMYESMFLVLTANADLPAFFKVKQILNTEYDG